MTPIQEALLTNQKETQKRVEVYVPPSDSIESTQNTEQDQPE